MKVATGAELNLRPTLATQSGSLNLKQNYSPTVSKTNMNPNENLAAGVAVSTQKIKIMAPGGSFGNGDRTSFPLRSCSLRKIVAWAIILALVFLLVIFWRSSTNHTNSTLSVTSTLGIFDTHLGALVAKLIAALAILLVSVSGIIGPLWWSGEGNVGTSRSIVFLSLGNCFSAGLLLGMGLLHFLPEAVEAHQVRVAAFHSDASSSSKSGGDVHDAHTHANTIEDKLVFIALLVGLCIPMLIDTIQHALVKIGVIENAHAHSHSHGISINHSQRSTEGTLGVDGTGITPILKAKANNSEHEEEGPYGTFQKDIVFEGEANIVSPEQPKSSIPSKKISASSSSSSSSSSSIVILSCLLTFHGITEGFMLGLESSGRTIISIMVPLCVHKFFDAFVLGLRMVGQLNSLTSWKTVIRKSIWAIVATLSTPVSLVVISVFVWKFSASDLKNDSTARVNPSLRAKESIPSIAYISSQAIGAGSFLYIALADILPAEFHKGDIASPIHRWNQLLMIFVGIFFVHLLSILFPHAH